MSDRHKPKSFQDRWRQRQQLTFVGRQDHLDRFRQNLALPIESRHFLFNIWGQGGVGKSTLIRQFHKIAEAKGWLTAYTDEAESIVPDVFGRLAEQLEQQGYKLPQLTERYRVFRQKNQELESDPEAPQGFSAFLGRTVAKAGLGLAKQIPGSGAITPFLDEEAVASQTSEWFSFIASKLGNKDEVLLVQKPIQVLTPLFLQDLQTIAAQQSIVLFLDTYEQTGSFLDRWLREVLEGRYGDLPDNMAIVIAGRDELNHNGWMAFESVLARLSLEPFTQDEALQYLAQKNITAPTVIDSILQLSGRLPVLMELLASTQPTSSADVGEPSHTAVERFLKWVDDPIQRQLALDAALPRSLNRDVVAQICGEEKADELWPWLINLSFVQERTDGWAYHDVVRTQMLRYKRLTSPQSWATLHHKLADYYEALRNTLELSEPDCYRDSDWQSLSRKVLYHHLCQAPQKYLPQALNGFLAALKHQYAFAQELASDMMLAGTDTNTLDVQSWGTRLAEGLKAYEDDRYAIAAEMFTALLQHSQVAPQWQSIAQGWRGETYRLLGQYDDALKDFDQAIALHTDWGWAIVHRGDTYQCIGQYDCALNDFNRAIELKSNYVEAIASRGLTYRLMQQYENAINDFNRAIKLEADLGWVMTQRGLTYRLMQQYENAINDFNHSIELHFEYTQKIGQRGETYQLMQQYENAINDFSHAIELHFEYAWEIAQRGETYRLMQQYENAINDFSHAIELNPKLDWAIACRGETYRLMEQYDNALNDFNRAIELKSDLNSAIVLRGVTYRLMKRYEDALKDLNHIIEIEADSLTTVLCLRGQIYLLIKQPNAALVDFNRVIEMQPDMKGALYSRAITYKVLQSQKMKADLEQAIQITQQEYERDPKVWENTFNLALCYLAAENWEKSEYFYKDALNRGAPLESIQEALQDVDDFLTVFPGDRMAQSVKRVLSEKIKL